MTKVWEYPIYNIIWFVLQENGILLGWGVWLCRISGGYSQEMSMLRISVPKSQFSCRLILMIMKCKYIHL